MRFKHRSVLLKESIELLAIKPGEKYIDATVGGGGHAEAILKKKGIILGIDQDPEAIEAAGEHLASACPVPRLRELDVRYRLARGNFSQLKEIAFKEGFDKVGGILFDLGVSSYQIDTANRGFSFDRSGPLDMRMDPDLKVTAADLINGLTERELNELFSKLGGERLAGRLAQAICRARRLEPIKTTVQLAEIIRRSKLRKGRLDPATKVFQALRIAVNDELNNLRLGLPQALELLTEGGRLVVISFHEGEDRIAKQFFKEQAGEGKLTVLTKKPLRSSREEVEENPRSRSGCLRGAEKK